MLLSTHSLHKVNARDLPFSGNDRTLKKVHKLAVSHFKARKGNSGRALKDNRQ